jgi:hypothetical protein
LILCVLPVLEVVQQAVEVLLDAQVQVPLLALYASVQLLEQ